jgi:hypothetical protein
MAGPRFLTKSRFKLAHECPTKLFYAGKKEFADQKSDDQFLKALADSGYQVGALAQRYYPGGLEVETADHAQAVKETEQLLQADNVIIYEGAIQFNNLFIRADIIKKEGSLVELIEVKAKAYDPEIDSFFGKRGGILAEWDEYVHDIAFQAFVFRSAFPQLKISPSLFLMNKRARCPTDGLNQKFLLQEEMKGRIEVVVKCEPTGEDLKDSIMVLVDATEVVSKITDNPRFRDNVEAWAKHYLLNEQISPTPSKACGSCQFYTRPDQNKLGLRSGLNECWQQALGISANQLAEPTILDLWDCRNKDELLESGKYLIKDLVEDDIKLKSDGEPGLSRTQRQWVQVLNARGSATPEFSDVENLTFEMAQWLFPLHFIDFETSAVAIPFNKGQRPYEGVAFQFSHHVVHEDGAIEHAGQFLHTKPGQFPSFEFARALKSELDKDYGTIFIYSHHENTYLNFIIDQLVESNEPDREKLISFFKTITKPRSKSEEVWEPNREMVDLCKIVKRFYWHPQMGGSNSIKSVLPAILNSSSYLKSKYSRPIYGAKDGIRSLNYKDHQWVRLQSDGRVEDPYKAIPLILADQDRAAREFILRGHLFKSDRLADGGAAMTAWARMQFTEMSDRERSLLANALLKYCELDTFAMVMLYEFCREASDAVSAEQVKSPVKKTHEGSGGR